jgi:GntP family gluconate:H+ symporter
VHRIADVVIAHSTPRSAPWLLAVVSFAIGIPMFFEVGLVVLLPVIYTIAVRLEAAHQRPRTWYLRTLIPAIAALSCLHGMVPPHPGPLIAVSGLHANVGLTILLGLTCAIPTVILAGPLYANFIAPRFPLEPPAELIRTYAGVTPDQPAPVPATGGAKGAGDTGGAPAPLRSIPTWMAFACMLVPVVLMLADAIVRLAAVRGSLLSFAQFIGDPVVAMLVAVVFAALALGLTSGMSGKDVRKSFSSALGPVAGIILIIAGGGAFNAVLQDAGIGQAIVLVVSSIHMNLIMLGWLVGIVLSFATGSATVGIVSATGIVGPLVTGLPPAEVSLIVIAIGAGSIGMNWVNHAGFWFVKEAFGMTISQATAAHMMAQTLVSVLGLCFALLLSIVV